MQSGPAKNLYVRLRNASFHSDFARDAVFAQGPCQRRVVHDPAAREVGDDREPLERAREREQAGDRRLDGNGDVPLDVAPLFESAAALRSCGEIMTQVFNEPAYRKHLIGRAGFFGTIRYGKQTLGHLRCSMSGNCFI